MKRTRRSTLSFPQRGEKDATGGFAHRIWRYHGGAWRSSSTVIQRGRFVRDPGCAQQVEGELSVEGTSTAAVAAAVAVEDERERRQTRRVTG